MKETMKDIILNASADMTESCHKTDFICQTVTDKILW